MNNLSQIQLVLILIGSICLAGAIGIKLGMITFRQMYLKPKVKFDFKTMFHTDAHPHGVHGTLYVDCPAKGWKAEPISFVFIGIPTSPQMSLDLMKKLWMDASAAGYIPLALRTYNQIHATVKPPRAPQAAVSGLEQRMMESNRRRTAEKQQATADEVDALAYDAITQSTKNAA